MGQAPPTGIQQQVLRTAPAPWTRLSLVAVLGVLNCAGSRAGGGGGQVGTEGATTRRLRRGPGARVLVCVCTSVHGDWYLGAMPGQNLPLAAGQRDLLLDGALEFIWKERREEG